MEGVEAPPPPQVRKRRRSIWLYVGSGCGLVILLIAAISYFGYRSYSSFQDESGEVAHQILTDIGEEWDPDVIWSYFSPIAKRTSRMPELERLCAFFVERIGTLERIDSLEFRQVKTYAGIGTVVTYFGSLTCTKGDATILLVIVQDGDEWQLNEFRLDSDNFIVLEEDESSSQDEDDSDGS